jgi:hypothetical protein
MPFGLICFSIVTLWYALHGHAPDDVANHRTRARWYTTKTELIVLLGQLLIRLVPPPVPGGARSSCAPSGQVRNSRCHPAMGQLCSAR